MGYLGEQVQDRVQARSQFWAHAVIYRDFDRVVVIAHAKCRECDYRDHYTTIGS